MRNFLNRYRRNDGFTLVELVVSILCATLVMGAVLTWLLVGIRIEKSAADTMEQQNKTRVIMSLMESMASNGKVVKVYKAEEGQLDWALLDEEGAALLQYDADQKKIISGKGNVLIEQLDNATADFDTAKSLLKLSLTVNNQTYSTDVFCRTNIETRNTGVAQILNILNRKSQTTNNRIDFVNLLKSQLGSNGQIIDNSIDNGGKGEYQFDYFTECYLANTSVEGNNPWISDPEWNAETPWCATYISWAMYHMNHDCFGNDRYTLAYIPMFADVNHGKEMFHEDYVLGSGFTDQGGLNTAFIDDKGNFTGPGQKGIGEKIWKYKYSFDGSKEIEQKVGTWVDSALVQDHSEIITAGDLIFFDWEQDNSLDHVGVVLDIVDGKVQTIEGNTNGLVDYREYDITDSNIVGYGILDWAGTTEGDSL
ncbi:MAG: CHAP domain-containing protein [Firmicutes bacterium]|nr:CHAP domain-containing protein [Bacillota bacterium]